MIAYLSLGPAGSLEFEIRLCLGATQPQGQELRNWKLRLSRPDGESTPYSVFGSRRARDSSYPPGA